MMGPLIVALLMTAESFQPSRQINPCRLHQSLFLSNRDNDQVGRRPFTISMLVTLAASRPAIAAIDVSGLRVEGGDTIASQLKAYNGGAVTIVQENKASNVASTAASLPSSSSSAATYAMRATLIDARLTRLGLGALYRYEDRLVGPSSKKYMQVSFEFPSDWLQLDKMLGGIQYVDQRNGDKLYLLRTSLPPGTTLSTVPKTFFGESIFDPQGSIAKGGTVVEDYKVGSSEVSSQVVSCPDGACSIPRRRLGIKYTTVTGNGLRVERRALVDCYEVDSEVYMLMTSSNAVKFEKKGRERETAEAIVDSFRIEQG